MRKINLLVVHCSDSPNGRYVDAAEIDRWHRERGFDRAEGWRKAQNYALTSIGYHFVIKCSGEVETGRHVDEIGAHVQGFNQRSLGVCMVGRDKFAQEQWAALKELITGLKAQYPGADTLGHTMLNPGKTCPNFDVKKWLAYDMEPLPEHLLTEVASA